MHIEVNVEPIILTFLELLHKYANMYCGYSLICKTILSSVIIHQLYYCRVYPAPLVKEVDVDHQ